MTRDEEKILIRKAQRGDSHAFEMLVSQHEGFVYNLALRTLRSPHDAEDAAQEVFLKAWTSLHAFRGDCKFSVWLYRICGSVCTDMLRKNSDTLSLTANDDEGDAEIDIADTAPSPHEALEKKERSAALGRALAELPEEYRSAVMLREISGLSYEEISQALSIDIGTVKSRIFRGRKKLCKILSEDGNFFSEFSSKHRKGGEQV